MGGERGVVSNRTPVRVYFSRWNLAVELVILAQQKLKCVIVYSLKLGTQNDCLFHQPEAERNAINKNKNTNLAVTFDGFDFSLRSYPRMPLFPVFKESTNSVSAATGRQHFGLAADDGYLLVSEPVGVSWDGGARRGTCLTATTATDC